MSDIINTKICLNCGESLVDQSRRNNRVFCNTTCRSNYWQKSNRLEKQGKSVEEIIKLLAVKKKPKVVHLTPDNKHEFDFLKERAKDIPQETKDKVHRMMNELEVEGIKKQIEAIRAEKIPAHRNTSMGKRSWEIEQKNRIAELQKQLNPPI